jgi:hypothetical protein
MAYIAPTTRAAGALITAAIWNQDVVANPIALFAGAMSIASQAANDLIIASSATQLGRVATSTGVLVAAGGVPSYDATPPVDGVQFPATQVASGDANMLDDYEEGTWTPVLGGSGGTSGQTYDTQVGRYVKIGKLVWVTCQITLSNKGTITGSVQIQGLPFTSENTTSLNQVGPIRFDTLATTWVSVNGFIAPNVTVASVQGAQAAAANNTTNLTTTDIANTTNIMWSCCYRATA